MKLLDQYGNPITRDQVKALAEPVATPTLAGVRPVVSESITAGMTPDILATILQDAERGNATRYLELAEAIEERDLHYATVISTRKKSVAQLPITVEPAGDEPAQAEHAAFVQAWLDTGILEAALPDMLDAIGKGFSVMEIDWRTEPGHFAPRSLTYKPQRWFETPVSIGQILGDTTTVPDGMQVMLREIGGAVPLNALKFVVHKHPAKSGLVMRGGIARLACWAWMFKAFTAGDWAAFCRNYGQPVRLGRYGPESTQKDRDVLWSAVANIAGDCAAIIPKSMEVEFKEVGDVSKGGDLYERRCNWLDQQMSKAVLGQTATTDAIAGGHAVGREHRQVQEDIERADAVLLAATITRQIIQPMVMLTFGPQEKYPKALIGRPDEMPADKLAEALAKLVPLGLRVGQGEIRRRLTLPDPQEDDELLGAPAAAAPGTPAGAAGGPPRPAPNAGPSVPAMVVSLVERLGKNAELQEALAERVALDMQGALTGLTDQVRREFEAAADMGDLQVRLTALRLDATEYGSAMAAALALAHLVGQASVLDEIGGK